MVYLKNYVVKPVDTEQVAIEDVHPLITVNLRRFADGELLQIERRQVPLDILLYASPADPRGNHDIPWDEIRDRLDELFVHFLESVSTTWSLNTWFDLLRLLHPSNTTYHLVVSSEIASLLIETGVPEAGIHGYGIPLYQHWLEIVTQPYLADAACYVIPPEHYATYLYKHISHALQRIWVCSFLDLTEQASQPICLRPQSVLDLLLSEPPGTQHQMEGLLSPLSASRNGGSKLHGSSTTGRSLTRCPECLGTIQYLNEQDAFCLDCDWDNLKPLR